MIILFAKSQSLLFDAPVRVETHIRKDGVVVGAHTRVQKVAPKKPAAPAHQPRTLDLFEDQPPVVATPEPAPKRRLSSEEWVNEGKTPADLAREKAERLGTELAYIIAEE